MDYPFEWHDWLRVVTFIVCAICVLLLAQRWWFNHRHWSPKTLDYWYSLVMWSLAGCVLTIEGILRNFGFGPRSIFVIAASSITLRGIVRKGAWGDSSSTSDVHRTE